MFQTQLRHVFRTDWQAANPLAMVIGAADGDGFEQARRCADDGYDLLVADAVYAVYAAAASLQRTANRVTALQLDLDRVEEAEKLLDSVSGRPVEMLLVHGAADGAGTSQVIETVRRAMQARGNGRILVDGREVFAATA